MATELYDQDEERDFELWSEEFDAEAWLVYLQHKAFAEANEAE